MCQNQKRLRIYSSVLEWRPRTERQSVERTWMHPAVNLFRVSSHYPPHLTTWGRRNMSSSSISIYQPSFQHSLPSYSHLLLNFYRTIKKLWKTKLFSVIRSFDRNLVRHYVALIRSLLRRIFAINISDERSILCSLNVSCDFYNLILELFYSLWSCKSNEYNIMFKVHLGTRKRIAQTLDKGFLLFYFYKYLFITD